MRSVILWMALASCHCPRAHLHVAGPLSRVPRRWGKAWRQGPWWGHGRGIKFPDPGTPACLDFQLGRIRRFCKISRVSFRKAPGSCSLVSPVMFHSWSPANREGGFSCQLAISREGCDALLLFSPETVSQVGMDSGQLIPRGDLKDLRGLCRNNTFMLFFLARTFSSCLFRLRIWMISQVTKTHSRKSKWIFLSSNSSSWPTLHVGAGTCTLIYQFIFFTATLAIMYFYYYPPDTWGLWGTDWLFALAKLTQLECKIEGCI